MLQVMLFLFQFQKEKYQTFFRQLLFSADFKTRSVNLIYSNSLCSQKKLRWKRAIHRQNTKW